MIPTKLLVILLLQAISEGFHVAGPPGPLVAPLGGTLLLPCFVETPLDVQGLEVEWKRTNPDALVHLFQGGESRPESQYPAYKNRADFFTPEIPRGNFSILLNNVTNEDAGIYRCKVYTDQGTNETAVDINVEYLVVMTRGGNVLSASVGGEVILNCSVDSHVPPEEFEEVTWKKTDKDLLVLLFQDGQVIQDATHEMYKDRVELFSAEIPKGNFSFKLKDVRTEDKGEYMCEVHTKYLSANSTVVLQQLGLSALHKGILFLCTAAILSVAVLGYPAFTSLRDPPRKAMGIHILVIFFPSICMFAAYIMWGVIEGFVQEAAACGTINLIRFLLLFKMAPYLGTFPDTLQRYIKSSNTVAEFSVFAAVVYSILFRAAWNRATHLIGEMFQKLFVAGCLFLEILLSFSAILGGKKKREKLFLLCLSIIFQFALLMYIGLTSAGILIGCGVLILLLSRLVVWCRTQVQRHDGCCAKIAEILPILCNVFIAFMMGYIMRDVSVGQINETAFLHILFFISVIKHQDNLPDIPHMIVYIFGVGALIVVNSITLATELIIKSQTGERKLTDLRLVVLPFESVFVFFWLILQLYVLWKKVKTRTRTVPGHRHQEHKISSNRQDTMALSALISTGSDSQTVIT